MDFFALFWPNRSAMINFHYLLVTSTTFLVFCTLLTPVMSPAFRFHPSSSFLVTGAEARPLLEALGPVDGDQVNRYPVCGFLSWRDQFFYIDYVVYILYLTTTTFNWFLLLQYVTDDKLQGYIYFVSAMLSSSTIFFQSCIFPRNTWEFIKLITGWIILSISVLLDNLTYLEHYHYWLTVPFFVLYTCAVVLIHVRYKDTAQPFIPIINRVANLFSALLLTNGVSFYDRWVYVRLEVHGAALATIYTIFSMFDSCDPVSVVLVVLTILTRVIHGYFIASRVFGGNRQAPEAPAIELVNLSSTLSFYAPSSSTASFYSVSSQFSDTSSSENMPPLEVDQPQPEMEEPDHDMPHLEEDPPQPEMEEPDHHHLLEYRELQEESEESEESQRSEQSEESDHHLLALENDDPVYNFVMRLILEWII